MFYIYLRTNSDLCHLQHKLIGFYNRDEKCLQRGTDWVSKYKSLRFVLKGLNGKSLYGVREQRNDYARKTYGKSTGLRKMGNEVARILFEDSGMTVNS